MFCNQCGREAASDAHFCSNCGRALVPQPVPQPSAFNMGYSPQYFPVSRLQNHLRTVGILWIIAGVLRALSVGWVWFVGRMVFPAVLSALVPHFTIGDPLFRVVRGGLVFATCVLVIQSALAILAGWGLLERQSWGRILAIIAGVLSLWHIPFGTALGIYTLWVLLPASSEMEYRRLARV